jgi:GTP1/Obg family GTP-binding protein
VNIAQISSSEQRRIHQTSSEIASVDTNLLQRVSTFAVLNRRIYRELPNIAMDIDMLPAMYRQISVFAPEYDHCVVVLASAFYIIAFLDDRLRNP